MLSVIWQLKCSYFYAPKSIYFEKSPLAFESNWMVIALGLAANASASHP